MEGSGAKGRGRRSGGRGRRRKRGRSPAREQGTTIPIYQTPAPQCSMLSMEGRGKGKGRAIGIDLGSSYCCVAVWRPRYKLAEIIKNEFGNRLTPSMVSFTSLQTAVGEGAYSLIAFNHVNTVFDVKRLVGMCFSDSCLQKDMKFWPFVIIEGADDKPLIQVTYREETKLFAPQDILSMLLMKMKAAPERYLECDAKDAVITVPAYFNDAQKRATEDAGKIAGLNVIQLLNEPTAAAIAYGFHDASDEEINLLVFDLGGGTFDVSVLSVERGKITVKAINGNVHLGGQDFDNRLVNYCVESFNTKYKVNVNTSFRALRRLRVECETAKKILSYDVECVIYLEGLYEGKDFFLKISRTEFEELNADLFEECMERTRKCLEDAHLNSYQIQDIILVGGSTRIPKLQELIRQNFGKEKLCDKINPDEVVAYGAAVQAAALNNEDVSLTLTDVTPLGLGSGSCEVERTPV